MRISDQAREQFRGDGYTLVHGAIPPELAERAAAGSESLWDQRTTRRGGIRHAIGRSPVLLEVANHPRVLAIVDAIGEGRARPVRSVLFDKTPDSNWLVPWHQDTTIAVDGRVEVAGYGPWSVKDGVTHCQPPARILDEMFTLRIHLDDCAADNGPLRLIAESHRLGILPGAAIEEIARCRPHVECTTDLGGMVVMRPLILHASPKADHAGHRRVLHIEYATTELDGDLRWRDETCGGATLGGQYDRRDAR